MDRRDFEKLVSEAVSALPDQFLSQLDNVEIVVEDFPSDEILHYEGIDSEYDLLGYYEGVPLTERGEAGEPFLPDRITIFQKPIEAVATDRADLVNEIQRTVVHEVAHYFGIDEDRLEELGWD